MLRYWYFLLLLGCESFLHAMTFDNRFFPLFFKPFTRKVGSWGNLRMQPFFMRGERATGEHDETSLPHIDGTYDQIQIAKALVATGHPNPLPSQFHSTTSIPWRREGHIDAQGIAFYYEQALGCYASLGTSFLFAHINSGQEFCLNDADLPGAGSRQALFNLRQKMDRELGVTPPLFKKLAFGDLDLYLRFGTILDYVCKMKRIDSGIKFGVIVPTAPDIESNNPASIPLGGQKHWGIYLGLENELELKEDWIVGYQFRAIKRLARVHCRRMPVCLEAPRDEHGNPQERRACEPAQYGAIVGSLRIDPGWTFVFNPYISLEGLREGFGLKAQYTLVAHLKDDFTDLRQNKEVKADLECLHNRSSWGSEYVTVGAFYDFSKNCKDFRWHPIISAYWDIPVDWKVSKRSAQTHSVSVLFELNF